MSLAAPRRLEAVGRRSDKGRRVGWLWGARVWFASLAILFIPSRVSVQGPGKRRMRTGRHLPEYSRLSAKRQQSKRRGSRCLIIGTDQTPLSNGSVPHCWTGTWRVASMALAPSYPRRVALICRGDDVRLGPRSIWPGRPSTYRRIPVPPFVGFLRPHIVVPRWLTKLSPDEQEIG